MAVLSRVLENGTFAKVARLMITSNDTAVRVGAMLVFEAQERCAPDLEPLLDKHECFSLGSEQPSFCGMLISLERIPKGIAYGYPFKPALRGVIVVESLITVAERPA
jgi:hypothetical protein